MNHSAHPTLPATDYPRDTQPSHCESTWRCSPALASMTLAEPDLRRTREEARRYGEGVSRYLRAAEDLEARVARLERMRVINTTAEALSDG